MQKLNINPELQSLIPPLTSEEYQQLTNNILTEGIREAILTWDGTIVDGHNRYAIANDLGIPFTTKVMQFTDLNECKEWMILNQFGRRNLQAFQRSVLALELEQVFRDKAKANQGTRIDIPQKSAESYKPIETRKELAKIANVSHDTIAKVKVLQAKATDEVKQQLRTGEVSINQAYKEIKKEEKRVEAENRLQERLIVQQEEVKVNMASPEAYNCQLGQTWQLGRHRLTIGSYFDYQDEYADACITDPPYGIDYDPDYTCNTNKTKHEKIVGDDQQFDPEPFLHFTNVCLFGANYYSPALPVGGWMVWDKRLTEAADAMLGSPFELAWFQSANTTKSSIMIRVQHGGAINADSLSGNGDQRFHPTQKPVLLMMDVINALTVEHDIVLDPFCGSGSTLLACEKTNRECIAYEIVPQYGNVILSRFYALTGVEPCLV